MVDGFRQGKPKGRDDASETLKEAHAKIGELTLEKNFFVVCWDAEQTGAAARFKADSPQRISRQCRLLDVARRSCYRPAPQMAARDLDLMRLINEKHMAHPFYGSRQMKRALALDSLAEALRGGVAPAIFNTDPGVAVHQRGVHGRGAGLRRGDVDGRARALAGQSVHRAAMAVAQVRRCASARVGERRQGAPSHCRMDRLPQRRTATLRPAGRRAEDGLRRRLDRLAEGRVKLDLTRHLGSGTMPVRRFFNRGKTHLFQPLSCATNRDHLLRLPFAEAGVA